MMKKVTRVLMLIALIAIAASTASAQNVRGYYITDIGNWLGDASKETDILEYTQGNGFNYILFYDLGAVNWSSTSEKNKLASFIKRAKTQYGVTQVGAVVEVYSFVTNYILPYNSARTVASERFDVINQEFEFWVNASISGSYCSKFLSPNGYSCDTAGAWKFCWKEFKKIDSICAVKGLISEFYLGWPNKGQMQQIVSKADRILLHAYRPTDSDVYSYSKNRLKDAASLNATKKIICLFSSEPSFMGSWLNTHPQTRPYQTYSSNLAAETASFKQYIDLQGYQWYTYQHMPKTMLATASITASGPLSFCSGGSVTLTANSGSAYLWSPGGQTTRSITVSNAGSYTVRVTNSNGNNATSSPAVVSYATSGAAPVITASGPLSFCPGGDVTLTAGTASTYLWSTGATTQSITVTTSGSYTVTTGGGSCSGTSAPTTVNANYTPSTPTITASGSLNICPGSPVTLTSSSANGYLWSNGETTRSIVVSAAGSYSVNAYSGPNCYATSVAKTVTLKTAPAKPSVSASGNATLAFSNATPVILSSSTASSFLWSNGGTTRSISVTTEGSYTVTITGSNGCTAMSRPIAVKKNGCTPPPVPSVTAAGSTVLSAGQSVVLTANSPGGYLWSSGQTTQSITVSSAGNYTVRVYDGPGCFSTSLPVNISVVAPKVINPVINTTSENKSFSNFSVYPNPARYEIRINYSLTEAGYSTFKLMDITGREVISREVSGAEGNNHFTVDVSEYPKGIYFASISNNETKQSIRIVVQ